MNAIWEPALSPERIMGHRCNLFVRENGRIEVYYDHWASIVLSEELFWGPELALAFVRSCHHDGTFERAESIDPAALLDEIWAEGGAFVDCDRSRLTFFSNADWHYNLQDHQVQIDLLRQTWRGWTVEWASEGQTTLARRLGLDEAGVLSGGLERSDGLRAPVLFEGTVIEWPILVTIRTGHGLEAATLSGQPEGIAHQDASPDALLALIAEHGLPPFALEAPHGGLHLDLERRAVGCWSITPQPYLTRALAERWGGWSVDLWGDDPSAHRAIVPDLPWPTVSDALRLSRLDSLESSVREGPRDPVAPALSFARGERRAGRTVLMIANVLFGAKGVDAQARKLAILSALRAQIREADGALRGAPSGTDA